MIQEIFFELIKKQSNSKTSFIDTIAMVLDISYDAAHRRLSTKSKLSLDEAVILAKHYNISIDQLFSNEKQHIITVKKTAPVTDIESLLAYFENSYNSLQPLVNQQNAEVIYCAKDLPIFYTSTDDLLGKFKMYAWLKILNPSKTNFSFDQFHPSLALLEASKKLGNTYKHIQTTEIWDTTTINSTLKQIHFYFESNLLSSMHSIELCDLLEELIKNIHKKITDKKEGFKFYYNELLLMNNRVLFKTPKIRSLYIPFTILSYYRTNDIKTCEQTEEFLKIQMEGSKLLNTAGEKERNLFFSKIYKRIDTLRTLIDSKNTIDFE